MHQYDNFDPPRLIQLIVVYTAALCKADWLECEPWVEHDEASEDFFATLATKAAVAVDEIFGGGVPIRLQGSVQISPEDWVDLLMYQTLSVLLSWSIGIEEVKIPKLQAHAMAAILALELPVKSEIPTAEPS